MVACPTAVNCQIQKLPDDIQLMVHIDHLKPHLGDIPVEWKDVGNTDFTSGVANSDSHVALTD